MRCKSCGYDLRELQEHRCPECGRSFDPDRPSTWLSRPMSGRRNLLAAIAAAVLFTIPAALGAMDSVTDFFMDHSPTALNIVLLLLFGPVFMITGLTISSFVLHTSCLVLLNRRPWVTHRNAFFVSLPISLVVLGYFFSRVILNLF